MQLAYWGRHINCSLLRDVYKIDVGAACWAGTFNPTPSDADSVVPPRNCIASCNGAISAGHRLNRWPDDTATASRVVTGQRQRGTILSISGEATDGRGWRRPHADLRHEWRANARRVAMTARQVPGMCATDISPIRQRNVQWNSQRCRPYWRQLTTADDRRRPTHAAPTAYRGPQKVSADRVINKTY